MRGGRIAGAYRHAAVVGQPEPRLEHCAGSVGGADDIGVDCVEHELGASEHGEGRSIRDITPGEVDESLTGASLYNGPPEVGLTVAVHDGDLGGEARGVGVCRDDLVRVAAELDADVHVGVISAVPARRVGADYPEEHAVTLVVRWLEVQRAWSTSIRRRGGRAR